MQKNRLPEEKSSKSVGIWLRVSTEDQARGESPEHHEKRARYYAASKEWEVKELYHLEGVSGKSVSDHPETQRMLEDIKTCSLPKLNIATILIDCTIVILNLKNVGLHDKIVIFRPRWNFGKLQAKVISISRLGGLQHKYEWQEAA